MTWDDFRIQLAALEAEDLIRPTTKDGSEFIFKHALIQDAAYELLLKNDRRKLHKLVAETIEQLFADEPDEQASRLAQHYLEAGDTRKTYEYAMRAGDRAHRLHAYPEARAHFSQASALTPSENSSQDEKRQRIDALIRHSGVSLFANDLNEQRERLKEAHDLLRRVEPANEDQLRHARIHDWLGRAFYFQNNMKRAFQEFQHVLDMSETLDDPEIMALPPAVIGRARVLQGHWAKAEPLLRKGWLNLKSAGKVYDSLVTLAFIGMAEMAQGEYRKGRKTVSDALEQARDLEHPTAINVCRVAYGYVLLNGSEYETVVEQARIAARSARKMDDHAWVYVAHGLCAWALGRMGKFEQAMEEFAQQEPYPARLGGSIVLSDWFAAARAEITLAMGEVERAIQLAESTVQVALLQGGVYAKGLAERVWGQALARMGPSEWAKAEAQLKASLRHFEEENARIEASRTKVALGELFQKRGKPDSARMYLGEAARSLEGAGLTLELEVVRRLIDENRT